MPLLVSAGDIAGIDSNTGVVGFYSPLGFPLVSVYGISNPAAVYPSLNGYACQPTVMTCARICLRLHS